MTKHDKELMRKILQDKKRYSIRVDNDAVWVQDNSLDEYHDNHWEGFDDYGTDFIILLFDYLGFDSKGV